MARTLGLSPDLYRGADQPHTGADQVDRGRRRFLLFARFNVTKDKKLTNVRWGGPAFEQSLRVGELIAVGDKAYSNTRSASRSPRPRADPADPADRQRGGRGAHARHRLQRGLRYPRLVKTGKGPGALDLLLQRKYESARWRALIAEEGPRRQKQLAQRMLTVRPSGSRKSGGSCWAPGRRMP